MQTLTIAQQCNFGDLDNILQREGFVIFICGAKEKGKTNLALLLGERCFDMGYKDTIATNIWTENYRIQNQITNLEALEDWLKEKGKKMFILDELGKHLRRMGFMSKKNQLILDAVQLIWHYRAGFIGCAPSESFVDNNYLNTDILDAKIRKITQKTALVMDYLQNQSYFLNSLPQTSIKYNRYDIAEFFLKKQILVTDLKRQCCKVAFIYKEKGTYNKTAKVLGLDRQQVRRLILEHIEHTLPNVTSD